jgi:hypothetical protein
VVEDEFAVRVGLQVGGRGGDSSPPRDSGVPRRPAQARAQAVVALEAGQEGVRNEGIAAAVSASQLAPSRASGIERCSDGLLGAKRAQPWSRYFSASSAAWQPEPAEVIAWR